MTETIITYDSNPLFWTLLNSQYINDGLPSHVTHGTEIYKVFHTSASNQVCFELVNNMDYIDSRSISGGRKASYKNLDNG